MYALKSKSLAAAIITSSLLLSPAAQADGVVRYVSLSGNNANNCLRATPCRTLQRGINQTPAGGELRVQQSGNYAAVATISKSITISGERPDVSLSRMALTINAPSETVSLRNLHFIGSGAVNFGPTISAATGVNIENCVFQGYTLDGVAVVGNSQLTASDSHFRNNGERGVSALGSSVKLDVSRSTFTKNGIAGVTVSSGARATIIDSLMSENSIAGMQVTASGRANVVRSAMSRNTSYGIYLNSGTAVISEIVIVETPTGVFNNPGSTLYTRQNNTFQFNTVNINGAGSILNLAPL